MDNGIIITVNLPGRINRSVRHTQKQTVKIDISEVGARKPIWVSRKIKHTDRGDQKCYKKVRISGELIHEWTSNTVPFWSNKREWSKLSKKQRIISYVARYDEGFGVTFEEV